MSQMFALEIIESDSAELAGTSPRAARLISFGMIRSEGPPLEGRMMRPNLWIYARSSQHLA